MVVVGGGRDRFVIGPIFYFPIFFQLPLFRPGIVCCRVVPVELLATNFFVNVLELLILQLVKFLEQDFVYFLYNIIDLVEDAAIGGGSGAVAGRRRRRYVKKIIYRVVGGGATRGGGRGGVGAVAGRRRRR